ncbi:DNA repair protein RAD16 [Kluyveromyces lactis]|uniref:KLLA0B09240p n=1 Tax=Kluyveromyces lactis (strain ATCC 8585 / CBS 2359 / DSM 70799 / NBRC 1267 / NRRL Y-1140 / WM37) TaxID=284590 RepID=Q6CVU9_KLULA|nr:uncharacterized protein KLLA0_B09240g [Kluyveromyces lactis]CAH02333.2 KLLA0B09240p [Kluyveromyces lactis]|eukprot:XP_451940.2 uncharacterized protein KLLA0_B09240g [Kluyveromyces lactis]
MEEGGFIRRTRQSGNRTRTAKKNVVYIESSSGESEDEPLVKKEIKSNKGNAKANDKGKCKTKGTTKANRNLDSDLEYDDSLVLLSDQTDRSGDESSDELKREQVVELISSSDDDEPLQNGPQKKKRKANGRAGGATATKKKPTKPKISPFERNTAKLYAHHSELIDVFKKLQESPIRQVERAPQPDGMAIRLLPFQLEGLHWLQQQEESDYNGGVLADEMGMGKTIQTIALLMSDITRKPSLVVAPTVALMQWKNEIEQHTNKKLSVYMYHGANRTNNLGDFKDVDVILTTYAVLESVYRKQVYGFKRKAGTVKEKSLLHSINFYRVILDEAHNIKDRTSNTAKAVNSLQTKKRWCLSGTPLQNRIGEMYSLIRFLNIEPFTRYYCKQCSCSSENWRFSDYLHCDDCGHVGMQHTNFFNHFMLKNVQKHGIEGPGLQSFQNIQTLLARIMLRRTKVERADDLGLPPRIVTVRKDYFNEEEKDLYQSLYSDIKRKYNSYVEEGVVLNNYANIFTLITRMRQMADHPDLVLKRLKGNNDNNPGVIICQLCDDEAEEPIESKCHHRFCRLCINEYIDSFMADEKKLTCPVCHIGLSIDLQQQALEVDEELFKKQSIVSRLKMGGKWRSSTKIEALVEELYNLRSDKRTIKSIVFSQFTSMLDLVEWRLKRAGFQTVKLQGSMTPTQRDQTIKYFMENIHCEVFLVSLKAGGVALNLCEASQVFILDPWWNPSVEWQSGDRVHRIGQFRPVKITRFCIEDSIESRIIELQEKKASMIHATINQDEAAINRLTPADLQFLFNN